MFHGYMLNYKRVKSKTALGCWVGDADFVPAASGTWFWGRYTNSSNSFPRPSHLSTATAQAQEVSVPFFIATYRDLPQVKPIAEKGQSGEVEFQAASDGDYFFHVGRPGSVVTHISGMILDLFRRICRMGAGNRQTCMNYWLTYTRLVAGQGNRRAKVRYMSYATYSWWSKWFIHDVLSYCFSTCCLKKCGHVG